MNLDEFKALIASFNSGVARARQDYALQGSDTCGTVAGYRRHKRQKTRVCLDCAAAYNARQRQRYADRKEQA